MYKQRGSVLLISLGLLVILTLMVFGMAGTVLNQEKMVINYRDDVMSLQVAEAVLKKAERELNNIDLSKFDFGSEEAGFYNAFCVNRPSDVNCPKIEVKVLENIYSEDEWAAENSREITTTGLSKCDDSEECEAAYKAIFLGDAEAIDGMVVITSQVQNADAGAESVFKLFKIIAMGTDATGNNRRIVVSYYKAPVAGG